MHDQEKKKEKKRKKKKTGELQQFKLGCTI